MGFEPVTFVESLFLADNIFYHLLVAGDVYTYIAVGFGYFNIFQQASVTVGSFIAVRLFYFISNHPRATVKLFIVMLQNSLSAVCFSFYRSPMPNRFFSEVSIF